MPWILARVTTNLDDDADWAGMDAAGSDAPAASLFFPIGAVGTPERPSAKIDSLGKIEVRIGFLAAAETGQPVPGVGTVDAEPVTIDRLPLETLAGGLRRYSERISVGAVTTITSAAWTPLQLQAGPRGLWTVRLTGMTAPSGSATRAAVWYWSDK